METCLSSLGYNHNQTTLNCSEVVLFIVSIGCLIFLQFAWKHTQLLSSDVNENVKVKKDVKVMYWLVFHFRAAEDCL